MYILKTLFFVFLFKDTFSLFMNKEHNYFEDVTFYDNYSISTEQMYHNESYKVLVIKLNNNSFKNNSKIEFMFYEEVEVDNVNSVWFSNSIEERFFDNSYLNYFLVKKGIMFSTKMLPENNILIKKPVYFTKTLVLNKRNYDDRSIIIFLPKKTLFLFQVWNTSGYLFF